MPTVEDETWEEIEHRAVAGRYWTGASSRIIVYVFERWRYLAAFRQMNKKVKLNKKGKTVDIGQANRTIEKEVQTKVND